MSYQNAIELVQILILFITKIAFSTFPAKQVCVS